MKRLEYKYFPCMSEFYGSTEKMQDAYKKLLQDGWKPIGSALTSITLQRETQEQGG